MNDQEGNAYAAPQSTVDGQSFRVLGLYARMMIAAGGIGGIVCAVTVLGIVLIGLVPCGQSLATVVLYLGIVVATIVGTVAFIVHARRKLQPWVFASRD